MMTDFRINIRARMGHRIGAGLDGLTPLFAAGQARRGIPATGDHSTGDVAAVVPSMAGGTNPHASGLPSGVDQSAPLASRGAYAAPAETMIRGANPYAAARPFGAEQLALLPSRQVFAARTASMIFPQRAGPMTAPTAPLRLVADHGTPVTRESQPPIRPVPAIRDKAGSTDAIAATGRTTAEHIPATIANRAIDNAGQPIPSRGSANAEISMLAIKGSSSSDSLQHSRQDTITPDITTVLERALSRRATVSPRGAARRLAAATVVSIAQEPMAAPLNIRPMQNEIPGLIGPRSLAHQQANPTSPMALLEAALPRADVRPTKTLSNTPTDAPREEAQDQFAFDLAVQASLSRLLQDDMRRHGLHPNGEVL